MRMKPLIEQLDTRKTRAAARKHLQSLGKKVIHQEIMDYIKYTNSVISFDGGQGGSSDNKVLNGMERKKTDQNTVSYYIKMIITNLNKLDLDQRMALLARYLYKFDEEEMEVHMNRSNSSIKRLLREAEIDFAIAMHCTVTKKRGEKSD